MTRTHAALAALACGLCAFSSAAAQMQPVRDTVLERLAVEYAEALRARDVGRLVRIDAQVRAAVEAFNRRVESDTTYPGGSPNLLLGAGAEALGVNFMVFASEFRHYSGKLLRDAHAINPKSRWRELTLWSTINEAAENNAELPNIPAMRAYLREFPRGRFAVEATRGLAWFFDDLYNAVRDSIRHDVSFRIECFGPYFTKAPLGVQLRAAKDSAVRYYRRLVALQPRNRDAVNQLADMRAGRTGGHIYCGD